MKPPSLRQITALKAALFVICLWPLAQLAWLGYADGLGANPIEFITRHLGTWTLNFLLITLAVTPLRHLSGWHWLIRLRRMLGLYAFFYATLHFLTYIWLDQFFDWTSIVKDITLPLLYAVLLGALLGLRALRLARERQRQVRAYL